MRLSHLINIHTYVDVTEGWDIRAINVGRQRGQSSDNRQHPTLMPVICRPKLLIRGVKYVCTQFWYIWYGKYIRVHTLFSPQIDILGRHMTGISVGCCRLSFDCPRCRPTLTARMSQPSVTSTGYVAQIIATPVRRAED